MYDERIMRTHFERSLLVQTDCTISELRFQQAVLTFPEHAQLLEKVRSAPLDYLRHRKLVNNADLEDIEGATYCRYMIECLRRELES